MTNHVLLNNIEHKDLKIITTRHEKYGDGVWYAMTFPAEFRTAQMCYPIFFHKALDSGKFIAVTLFGFEEGENLYLNEAGWDAPYIPMTILRKPFLIGRQRITEDGRDAEMRVVHVDMDDPRISYTEGQPVFGEFGGNSPYLERVATVLEVIHEGISDLDHFTAILLQYDLLEPFTLQVELLDDVKHQLIGFYTINQEKLRELSGEALSVLHKNNYLEPIYMQIGSQAHINRLVVEKNKRIATKQHSQN